MEVFSFLFVYLLLVKFFISPQKRKTSCFLSALGLWVVLAFRSPYCGIDLISGPDGSANYYNMFQKARDASLMQIFDGDLTRISNMERGWLFYCKFASVMSDNFQVFLALTAFIQLCLISFIIYKYSSDIVLSFVVFFCFGLYVVSFSGIRQSTAFAITFFSVHFLITQKLRSFFPLILLASTIHSSSLIFLLAFPLNNIHFSSAKGNIAILLFFFLLPFHSTIVNLLVPFVFGSRYQDYQDSGGAITLFLLYVLLFAFSLKIKMVNKMDNLLRGLIAMAVICQSLGYIGSGAITRIGFYFSIFFMLLFPCLVKTYSNYNNRSFLSYFVSVLLFCFFFVTNKDGYLNVIPYYFFWQSPF